MSTDDEFQESLARFFPGSVTAADYLDRLKVMLGPLRFTEANTLALVSICRDELTSPFFEAICADWGPAFTLAGLGGVPALGRTGWAAALGHVPEATGRGRVLVLGFPHIGIESDGSVGLTMRPGQDRSTATCGALCAIYAMVESGTVPTEVDVDDYEATKLAIRLVDPDAPPASLIDLTVAALDALEIDLWSAIDAAEVWRDHDVTVWCGVQIHGHGGADWIWPRDAWFCGADGVRRPF